MKTTLVMCLAVLGCSACLGGPDCQSRTVTPTGNLATDMLGAWDWSAGGLSSGKDLWVYAFHSDGGLLTYHKPFSNESASVDNEAYSLIDGGFALSQLTYSASVTGNTLNVSLGPAFGSSSHAALTCAGIE